MTRRHNKLSRKNSFKLMRWVEKQWPWITATKPTYDACALRANRDNEIDFPVTPSNIAGIVKDLDRTWPGTLGMTRSGTRRGDAMRDVKVSLGILGRAVVNLYEQYGVTCPNEVRVIAGLKPNDMDLFGDDNGDSRRAT